MSVMTSGFSTPRPSPWNILCQLWLSGVVCQWSVCGRLCIPDTMWKNWQTSWLTRRFTPALRPRSTPSTLTPKVTITTSCCCVLVAEIIAKCFVRSTLIQEMKYLYVCHVFITAKNILYTKRQALSCHVYSVAYIILFALVRFVSECVSVC